MSINITKVEGARPEQAVAISELQSALVMLNKALKACATQGVTVDLEPVDVTALGDQTPRVMYGAKVSAKMFEAHV